PPASGLGDRGLPPLRPRRSGLAGGGGVGAGPHRAGAPVVDEQLGRLHRAAGRRRRPHLALARLARRALIATRPSPQPRAGATTTRSWSALRTSAMPACAHTSESGESTGAPRSPPPRAFACSAVSPARAARRCPRIRSLR